MKATPIRLSMIGLVAFAGLVMLSNWYAPRFFVHHLETQLNEVLVDALIDARVGQVSLVEGWDDLTQKVEQDLAWVAPARHWGPVKACSARVLRLQQQRFAASAGEQRIVLEKNIGAESMAVELGVSCQRNWTYILFVQGLIVLAGLVGYTLIPRTLSPEERGWAQRFAATGCTRREARAMSREVRDFNPVQLAMLALLLGDDVPGGPVLPQAALAFARCEAVAVLNEASMAWFERALALFSGDRERALAVAGAPPCIEFQPSERAVRIHGVESKLPSTPFFYYYWYAVQRVSGADEGWYLNPPSNRSDHEHATALIALMEQQAGHARAINELREKGLRAKVLDQNRSKVKDHLTALLGEALATEYLFEDSRDARSGRTRYRLAVPPSRITLPTL